MNRICKLTTVVILVWICTFQSVHPQRDQRKHFLELCQEYKTKDSAYHHYVLTVSCDTLWTFFRARYYEQFAERAFSRIATNKTVFYDAFHGAGWIGNSYVTLEDTFPGFIALQMDRCQPGHEDIVPCTNALNKYFAASSWGVVSYLIDGDTDQLYNKSGIHQVIIPNLPAQVCHLRVYIRRSSDHPENNCGDSGMDQLATAAYKKYKLFSCVDDMEEIHQFFCSEAPGAAMCRWLYEKWEKPAPGRGTAMGGGLTLPALGFLLSLYFH